MVVLSLFENSAKDQTLRTLTSLALIIISDLVYQFLYNRNLNYLWTNKLAYFNVWITLAIVFGVSTIKSKQTDNYSDINSESIKNHAYYGILIGLLVYVPMCNWLLSVGKIDNVQSLCNTAFGIVIASIACLCTFLISAKVGLFN